MNDRPFQSATILLPAVNETYSMRETVDTLLATCDKSDLRELFIVLCDRTTPACAAAAEGIRDMGCGVPVVIYYQQRPFVGMAIREAFERARGSHAVLMSTDLETDPRLVARMIAQAKKNPDAVVTASRWIRGGGFRNYSKLKLVLNYIFQKSIGIFFLTRCTDLTYGYRLFPTALVQSIRWEEEKHPFFLETILKPLRLGVRVIELPVKWEARTEGASQNTFFQNFKYFKTAWHIRWMKKEDIM
ncbi:MAG: glycosyltransferase family 2 protein [Oscillospiraceae bacterium]|nr:glycosyltransferase family 2 protein [Oscillospiraceae bacterium]